MRPLTLEPGEGATPHRVYDLSIPDVEERKRQALDFRTATAAAAYLGIPPNKIFYWRTPGKRLYSAKHKKEFAIRVSK